MLTMQEFGSGPSPDGHGITSLTRHLIVPDAIAQEMVDFLTRSKRWHEDVEIVHDRVRRWRQAIRAHNQLQVVPAQMPDGAASSGESGRYPWVPRAVALRAEGRSWRVTARAVGAPEATVRRMVNRAGVAA